MSRMFQISNQLSVYHQSVVGGEEDSNGASSVQPEDFLNLNELPQQQQQLPNCNSSNSNNNKLNIDS